MNVEIRSDGLHISGYVNVPGRESRPIRDARGSFVEVIEQGAFRRAIERAVKIDLKLDHNRTLASTADDTLKLKEDEVGLHADTVVTDEETIKEARAGHLRGWSFGFRKPVSKMEERGEGQLPLRRISDLELNEVTLVLNKIPVYRSHSIELRAGEEDAVEYRAVLEEVVITEGEPEKQKPDLAEYKKRLSDI